MSGPEEEVLLGLDLNFCSRPARRDFTAEQADAATWTFYRSAAVIRSPEMKGEGPKASREGTRRWLSDKIAQRQSWSLPKVSDLEVTNLASRHFR